MKNENLFKKETIKVRDRKTGKIYDCFAEVVDLNLNKKYCLRYNIGINGYFEWKSYDCVYQNDIFNRDYEVISL